MGDRKRSSPTILSINQPSPNRTSISKKRKITSVNSDEFYSDHTPVPRFSSGDVVKRRDATSLDPELETKGLESNATKCNPKSFREEEMDEFFARFEREEQKRFSEKYNFDIVRDMPLEGRYEWVGLH